MLKEGLVLAFQLDCFFLRSYFTQLLILFFTVFIHYFKLFLKLSVLKVNKQTALCLSKGQIGPRPGIGLSSECWNPKIPVLRAINVSADVITRKTF